MSGHGEKRSRKQDAAIVALLSEPTIAGAATRAGVSEPTLFCSRNAFAPFIVA